MKIRIILLDIENHMKFEFQCPQRKCYGPTATPICLWIDFGCLCATVAVSTEIMWLWNPKIFCIFGLALYTKSLPTPDQEQDHASSK